jgi:alkylation response protein AidB-like acyl-CoA dehydrogenase
MTTTESAIDRDELRAAARDMLDDTSTSAAVRAIAETDDGFDAQLWKQFGDVGWPSIEIAEAYDGAGATFGDLAVVLVEMGRHLAANSLPATTVLAAGALRFAGDDLATTWLPQIAAGTARGTAALLSATGEPDLAGFTAARSGSGWVVTGSSGFVADAHVAHLLVLRASTADGETLFAVETGHPGLTVSPTPMLDVTRRFSDVIAEDVVVDDSAVVVSAPDAAAAIRGLLDRAALATACDALGLAEQALELTVENAKTRVQFDRPIGSFQAVKHTCTNMFIAVETARVALAEAVDRLDGDPQASSEAVSRAKAYCCDTAASVTADGVRMHGGIGFTWEHDMHLLVKRARLNQAIYGDSRWHRRRVADLILPMSAA